MSSRSGRDDDMEPSTLSEALDQLGTSSRRPSAASSETVAAREASSPRRASVHPVSRQLARIDDLDPTLLEEAPLETVEAVRYLLGSLRQRAGSAAIPQRLALTSAIAGEGVSFVSRLTASAFAHDIRHRVFLVDLNWVTPEQPSRRGRRKHRRKRARDGFDDDLPGQGIADVLRGDASFDDVSITRPDGVTVVNAGEATVGEANMFARSEELTLLIDTISKQDGQLILDLPPVLASSAAIPLSQLADAVVLVVRHGVTTEVQVRQAIERLGDIQLAGIVMNNVSSSIPKPLLRRITNW